MNIFAMVAGAVGGILLANMTRKNYTWVLLYYVVFALIGTIGAAVGWWK